VASHLLFGIINEPLFGIVVNDEIRALLLSEVDVG
jgi:hypothetical protein